MWYPTSWWSLAELCLKEDAAPKTSSSALCFSHFHCVTVFGTAPETCLHYLFAIIFTFQHIWHSNQLGNTHSAKLVVNVHYSEIWMATSLWLGKSGGCIEFLCNSCSDQLVAQFFQSDWQGFNSYFHMISRLIANTLQTISVSWVGERISSVMRLCGIGDLFQLVGCHLIVFWL